MKAYQCFSLATAVANPRSVREGCRGLGGRGVVDYRVLQGKRALVC